MRNLLNDLHDHRDVNWTFISPPALLGADAGFSVADLVIAIADDAEKQVHLFKRFTVASK